MNYEQESLPLNRILQGDALEVLRDLPDESVNCVVTSPPYWGLRDYGTAKWEGGNPSCQHTVSRKDADRKAVFNERVNRGDRTACLKCGARRIDEQIGLEETPEEYVAKMVEVFREVRRVLRDDGVLWLNLGSSYCSRVIESQEMVLRDDLTLEERRYVLEELAKHAR
jgi:DNA modification methylase